MGGTQLPNTNNNDNRAATRLGHWTENKKTPKNEEEKTAANVCHLLGLACQTWESAVASI